MDQVARTVLALAILLLVAGVVPLVDGVRQARAVVWSATRGAIQLLVVGLVLGAVFRAPLAVLPVLAVMVAAATATVTPRLAELPTRRRWWRPIAVVAAVTTGATVTTSVVFATGALALQVRNVVALVGITVGGAMTASTLAGRRFVAELRGRRAEVEGKLALGATTRQATADLVGVAVAEALVPALDQTRTTSCRPPLRRRRSLPQPPDGAPDPRSGGDEATSSPAPGSCPAWPLRSWLVSRCCWARSAWSRSMPAAPWRSCWAGVRHR
ncbi:MAG: ABC transporter permease [Actinomycetota bacterium]